MSSKPKTPDLQTIDPTKLTTVSGGASRTAGGDDAGITAALSGIMDSLSSLAKSNQQSSGFGMNEMIMMMMMMGPRNQQQVVAAAPQPTNWTWDANGGYWIVK